jgi:uncharacterized protein YjeT (DUF2065 family)
VKGGYAFFLYPAGHLEAVTFLITLPFTQVMLLGATGVLVGVGIGVAASTLDADVPVRTTRIVGVE